MNAHVHCKAHPAVISAHRCRHRTQINGGIGAVKLKADERAEKARANHRERVLDFGRINANALFQQKLVSVDAGYSCDDGTGTKGCSDCIYKKGDKHIFKKACNFYTHYCKVCSPPA